MDEEAGLGVSHVEVWGRDVHHWLGHDEAKGRARGASSVDDLVEALVESLTHYLCGSREVGMDFLSSAAERAACSGMNIVI